MKFKYKVGDIVIDTVKYVDTFNKKFIILSLNDNNTETPYYQLRLLDSSKTYILSYDTVNKDFKLVNKKSRLPEWF